MSPGTVTRRLSIGLIVLVLLLVVQLAVRHLANSVDGEEAPRAERFLVDFEGTGEIDSVRIETAERVLGLERTDSARYRIALEDRAIPARRERVGSLLEVLLALDRSSLVTENPDRHESLRVSPGETPFARGYDYRLTLTGQSIGQREIFVGVSVESPHVYVRVADEDRVYRNRDRLSFYLDQKPVYWAELRVFADATPIDEIERMTLTEVDGTREVTLMRSTDARLRFQRAGEDEPDYAANEELVRRVLSLEGAGFIDEVVSDPSWHIEIHLDDGRTVEASVGRQRRGVYPTEISHGEAYVTGIPRPTIALRAELFEAVLERLSGERSGMAASSRYVSSFEAI